MPENLPDIPLKKAEAAEYGDAMEAQVTHLMTRTKAGDADAFNELTRTLRSRAFGVARSLVGSHDDALDLCQEAFLKTYRARETFRDGEPFLPWFHRILRNTCFSFLRKHRRIRSHSITGNRDEDDGDWELEGHEPPPSAGAEHSEVVVTFWKAFERLKSRDREILSLRHFEELSYRQIAHALEIPEGTVMSRLFHARRRLREYLNPYLDASLSDYAIAAAEADEPRDLK